MTSQNTFGKKDKLAKLPAKMYEDKMLPGSRVSLVTVQAIHKCVPKVCVWACVCVIVYARPCASLPACVSLAA